VRGGAFRRDLFYRINVLCMTIPPLLERREDIMELAGFFLSMYAARFGKRPLDIPAHVAAALTAGSYDGNVRELQSLIERCVILSGFDSLPDALQGGDGAREASAPAALTDLRTAELRYIEKVYASTGGSVSRACAILGINRSTLWRKMKGCAPPSHPAI
jgi:two-component system response regulator AtoC